MTRRQCGFLTVTLALLLTTSPAIPAAAGAGTFTDPDDVDLPLDLKTIVHDNDGSTVIYTIETYEPFKDADADFRWGIDKTGDQKEDNFISVEYDGKLVGKVEDAEENELGGATVTRPGPNSLRVSVPRKFLGGVATYGYSVRALTDKNDNGEADQGETDTGPDTGFYPHQL